MRETNRNGVSFYFGYDGVTEEASCVRTWGDGGIYDRIIDYDKIARTTAVTDGEGGTTIYRYDELGAVTQVIDPCGGRYEYEYDDVDVVGHGSRV